MNSLIKIRDLDIRYGELLAVNKLSMNIKAGSITSLVGSNGAGKTSTLRAISGLVTPSAGSIVYAGDELLNTPAVSRVYKGIAHVPEGRQVFANLSVTENLLLGAYIHTDKLSISRDLDEVRSQFPILGKRGRQSAGSLSGGEQQMLAIGRALMSRPQCLILDEPTMGLAPQMVELILESISAINARGITILMVEQNAMEAIRIATTAFVLRQGSVVYQGAGESLDSELLKSLYLGQEGEKIYA